MTRQKYSSESQHVFTQGQRVKLPRYFIATRGYVTGPAVYCEPRYPGARDDDNIYYWPVSMTVSNWTLTVLVNGDHLTPVPQHEDNCPSCTCEARLLDSNSTTAQNDLSTQAREESNHG